MPTGRLGLGATVVNGVLYAVGGNNTSCTPSCTLGTVEAYDPASNTWTPKVPMPTRRSRLGLAVVNGVLYAVGGENPILATVEAYDPASNTWTSKAPMPTPRSGLGVAMAGGVLYAVGGYNSVSGYVATVEAYQP